MPDCRGALAALDRRQAANAALLLARYLHVVSMKNPAHPGDRKELLDCAAGALRAAKPCYQQAFDRRKAFLSSQGTAAVFGTCGRLVLGLGTSSVLETGISLLSPYGVPYLPGSALKGLAAHYGSQVWGGEDAAFAKGGEAFRILFGDTEDAGFIVFHDAWMMPESLNDGLVLDVMTPHHGDYYKRPEKFAPTDFDDPNPVHFLSVTGDFLVTVSCMDRSVQGEGWESLALDVLKSALESWGIGGKTNAGYGRMSCKKIFEQAKNPVKEQESRVMIKMTGVNKKGNPQFVLEGPPGVRCVFEGSAPTTWAKGETKEVLLVRKSETEYTVRLLEEDVPPV